MRTPKIGARPFPARAAITGKRPGYVWRPTWSTALTFDGKKFLRLWSDRQLPADLAAKFLIEDPDGAD